MRKASAVPKPMYSHQTRLRVTRVSARRSESRTFSFEPAPTREARQTITSTRTAKTYAVTYQP